MALFFIAIAVVVLAAAFVVVRTLREEKRAQTGRLARGRRSSRAGHIQRAGR